MKNQEVDKKLLYNRIDQIVRDVMPADGKPLYYYPQAATLSSGQIIGKESPLQVAGEKLQEVIERLIDEQIGMFDRVYVYIGRDDELLSFEFLDHDQRVLAEEFSEIEVDGHLIIGWD